MMLKWNNKKKVVRDFKLRQSNNDAIGNTNGLSFVKTYEILSILY